MAVFRATCLVLLLSAQGAHSQNCAAAQLDLMFVLDASVSVNSTNFQLQLNFLDSVVQGQATSINNGDTRVGLIRYSTCPSKPFYFGQTQRIFDLNTYNNVSDVSSAILATAYVQGLTCTGYAIDIMLNESLQASAGDRAAVADLAIVVTDGIASDDVVAPVARAYARGVEMYAIGIAGANITELNAIATDPDSSHVFLVNSFADLGSFSSIFTNTLCTNVAAAAAARNGDAFSNDGDRPEVIGGIIGGTLALIGAAVTTAVCCVKAGIAKKRNKEKEDNEPELNLERDSSGPVSMSALEPALQKVA